MSFEKLAATVDAIQKLMREAEQAARLPSTYKFAAGAVSIYYDRDQYKALGAKFARDLQAATVIHAERQGELERDTLLLRITAELESLRVLLPDMAAHACIDIGVTARGLLP